VEGVAKLLALKFVRGCEKNRDMQALETFMAKHGQFVQPREAEIYSATVKAIANAYTPPPRKTTESESDEERGWIESLETGDHTSGGEATKGEKMAVAKQSEEKGDWMYRQAWTLFHKMPQHNIQRTKDIYDAMIELACKRASIKRALALYREMQQEAEKEQREVCSLLNQQVVARFHNAHTLTLRVVSDRRERRH
jgi:pentatricopeptide repeat protein